jgi:hypothetical protein
MFEKLLANTLYVQIRPNAFRLRQIEARKEYEVLAQTPFTTTRLLVGQFGEAQSLLRTAVQEIDKVGFLKIRPVMVMHPLEMVEGGLSEIEERVYHELAIGAGARSAFVYVGSPLTDADVMAVSEGMSK